MNWAIFDWGSFWLGLMVGLWLAVILRDLGEYVRKNRQQQESE